MSPCNGVVILRSTRLARRGWPIPRWKSNVNSARAASCGRLRWLQAPPMSPLALFSSALLPVDASSRPSTTARWSPPLRHLVPERAELRSSIFLGHSISISGIG
ncbi:hypothetical protein K466DRAFT_98422 [Polyporus arcularius HHB13444]|uniref:Uncharacterized protein n=1 Tax=Polyporus arcularius HHB13444 TaxID=1314778 RepID=A0A5C3PDD2_9APHY|nr:hypothetical protein K466DRAFT_98422 [Polyporus arcularius HHB13444]